MAFRVCFGGLQYRLVFGVLALRTAAPEQVGGRAYGVCFGGCSFTWGWGIGLGLGGWGGGQHRTTDNPDNDSERTHNDC